MANGKASTSTDPVREIERDIESRKPTYIVPRLITSLQPRTDCQTNDAENKRENSRKVENRAPIQEENTQVRGEMEAIEEYCVHAKASVDSSQYPDPSGKERD